MTLHGDRKLLQLFASAHNICVRDTAPYFGLKLASLEEVDQAHHGALFN